MQKSRRWLAAVGLAVGTLVPAAFTNAQALLSSTFTYQGQLIMSGNPVQTPTDFRFTLVDSLGNVVAGPVTLNSVSVSGGAFTVNLDFGFDVFEGHERLLKIEVRNPAGSGAFTTLTPDQPITAAPYALTARRGEVPWVVQKPGSANSVVINPDAVLSNSQLTLNYFGSPTTRIFGGAGGGLATHLYGSSSANSYWGTDNDGSAIGVLLGDGANPSSEMVRLDARDFSFGVGKYEGSVTVSSRGPNAQGGIFRARHNNNDKTTFEVLGGGG